MKTQTIHIYRHSDSYQLFCGAEYQKAEPHDATCALVISGCKEVCDCTVKVDCEDCTVAKAARRQEQAEAARRAIEARKARVADIPVDFEIYD